MMGMIEPILEDKARMDEVVELEEEVAKLEAEMLEVEEQSNFHQKNPDRKQIHGSCLYTRVG